MGLAKSGLTPVIRKVPRQSFSSKPELNSFAFPKLIFPKVSL
jgi:hypothetical protein